MEEMDNLKYDILDALRDLKGLAPSDSYKAAITSLIVQLRKCKIVAEDKYEEK